METFNLAGRILDILPQVMGQIRKEMRRALPVGMSPPQFRILAVLNRGSGSSQASELARDHGVTQAAMSKMINSMVKQGLVQRIPGKADRRQIELRITPRGKSVYSRIRAPIQEAVSLRLSSLDTRSEKALGQGIEELGAVFLAQAPRESR